MSKKVRAAIKLPEGWSLETLRERITEAVRAHYAASSATGWSYVESTMDGEVVVAMVNDGVEKLYRHEWSLDGETVTVASERTPVEERTSYVPVAASLRFEVHGSAPTTAKKLEVRVIGTGEGENSEGGARWFVPATEDGIGSAVKVFGGARVHWHAQPGGTYDHADKAVGDWIGTAHDIGYLSDLRATEDGLYASLHLDADTPDFVRAALVERRVGLSVEAAAERRPVVRDGKRYVELVNWRHPDGEPASVAVVTHPALRGEVLRIAASRKETPMSASTAPAPAATDQVAEEAKKVLASLKRAENKVTLRAKVAEAQLPEAHAQAVIASVSELIDLDAIRDEKLTERIAASIEAQRKLIPAPKVEASGSAVSVGAGGLEKFALGLERLFLGTADARVQKRYAEFEPSAKGKVLASREQEAGIGLTGRAYSYRRLVRETLGVDVDDLLRPGPQKIRASVNLAQWGDVFENVLNKVGLAYQEDPNFGDWRKIVQIRNFTGSTLKQERMVVGGYANLPSVSEGASYTAATTPGDQGHGYTVLKYGYTESWTRESQINDNFGNLVDIVRKMALAADRTKYEYFFDLLTISGKPTMDYDSTALYHADHGNLATTALSATSLKARRLNMKKRTDFASSKRLGLKPRFLIVPEDLEETAFDLLKPLANYPGGSTTDNEFVRQFMLEAIVVRHWTNQTDWFLEADPQTSSIPVYEAGFLNGKETAEIYVQDAPNVGSVFERDAVTVKIAQDYFGGSPLRHEAFDGNDVA